MTALYIYDRAKKVWHTLAIERETRQSWHVTLLGRRGRVDKSTMLASGEAVEFWDFDPLVRTKPMLDMTIEIPRKRVQE